MAAAWDKYDYFILSLPTGVGKTFISTSIANSLGPDKKAYLLTSTLQLQTQYENSWQDLVNIKGRSNYQCNLNPEFRVDHAPCTVQEGLVKQCRDVGRCSYYAQRDKAMSSQSMITNPLYFLYTVHCGFLSDPSYCPVKIEREVLIVDEAHNLESHIIQFSESKLDFAELHEKHDLACKSFFVTDDEKKNNQLIQDLVDLLKSRIDLLKGKLQKEFPFDDGRDLKDWAAAISKKTAEKAYRWQGEINYLDKVLQPINVFNNTSGNWLVHPDVKANTLTLTPLRASFLFHYYLGNVAKKYVFLSATTGDFTTFCKELGIPKDKALFIETDTPFPPEKSPVVAFPMLKMGYKDIDASLPLMAKMVDELLEQHKTDKGIIHCATYKLQTEILNRVEKKHRDRLVARDKVPGFKPNNETLLKQHAADEGPSVLLSPSMMEGIDLYDELSRFQVILKFPWASLVDPRVAAKSKLDPEWYTNKTWMHIMQAAGRSTRHENDESVTYILDASFPYFYGKWKKRLPTWFTKRITIME